MGGSGVSEHEGGCGPASGRFRSEEEKQRWVLAVFGGRSEGLGGRAALPARAAVLCLTLRRGAGLVVLLQRGGELTFGVLRWPSPGPTGGEGRAKTGSQMPRFHSSALQTRGPRGSPITDPPQASSGFS